MTAVDGINLGAVSGRAMEYALQDLPLMVAYELENLAPHQLERLAKAAAMVKMFAQDQLQAKWRPADRGIADASAALYGYTPDESHPRPEW